MDRRSGIVSVKTMHLALFHAAETEAYVVVAVRRVVVVAIGDPEVVGVVVPAAAPYDAVGPAYAGCPQIPSFNRYFRKAKLSVVHK